VLSARAGNSEQEVEALLEEAMVASETQQSLAWRLRCATSLAEARQRRGAYQEAQELLAPVYSEFTEGFESADLRHARYVLDSCRVSRN
jgi:predicted ATPase